MRARSALDIHGQGGNGASGQLRSRSSIQDCMVTSSSKSAVRAPANGHLEGAIVTAGLLLRCPPAPSPQKTIPIVWRQW